MNQRATSMTKLEVLIMDQAYTLSCPETEQKALLAAVEKVNETMCGIRDAGRVKLRDRIAVLAALNIAHEPVEPDPAEVARQKRIKGLIQRMDKILGNNEATKF